MKTIFKGIYTAYNANAALKAATKGGLHLSQAPLNTKFPYIVYHKITSTPIYDFNDEHQEFTIQFSLFDDSVSAITILELLTKLRACFDFATLTLTLWTSIYMRPEMDLGLEKVDKIWNQHFQYRILTQKN